MPVIAFLAIIGSSIGSTVHAAQDMRPRAVHNSERILTTLTGVLPAQVPTIIASLTSGSMRRFAAEEPVWILSSDTGIILYYQGNSSFVGKPASELVDDNGSRFGEKALDNAAKSRASWLMLNLGGAKYPAYCASQQPLIVCSLAVPNK